VSSNDTHVAAGGAEISFEVNGQRCAFTVPPPGDESKSSVFLLGLPKAGSTLLNRIMRPLTERCGLTFVAVQEVLRDIGVRPQDYPDDINQVFAPRGYAFGGFRSLPGEMTLPAFAAGRTVLLVRDPRDMLTSLYFSLAVSHRPPGQGAGGQLAESFEQKRELLNSTPIDEFVLDSARIVAGQFRQVETKLVDIQHKLYRYEDIIFDKLAWTRDMLNYLGLEPRPVQVERVVAQNDVRPVSEDVSQHVRKVAPGDHRDKLKPETIAQLTEALAPVLTRYGYA
jgi:hypothetical protein